MTFLQKYPILGSSVNEEQVSRTLISLAPLITLLVLTFKIDIQQTEIETYLLTAATIINGCFTLFYGGRKIYYAIKDRVK